MYIKYYTKLLINSFIFPSLLSQIYLFLENLMVSLAISLNDFCSIILTIPLAISFSLDEFTETPHLPFFINLSDICPLEQTTGNPIIRYSNISGVPIPELIKLNLTTKKRINDIIQRTRDGGAEIGKLMQKSSAFYAPASSAILMAESFLYDQKRVLPCAAYLKGEYGVKGLYVGVPAIIGNKGIEKIIEFKLNSIEKKQFKKSVNAVKKLTKLATKLVNKNK